MGGLAEKTRLRKGLWIKGVRLNRYKSQEALLVAMV